MCTSTKPPASARLSDSGPELVGADATSSDKTPLEKHNPKTNRQNTSEEYRGCRVIQVHQSAELCRRIEGSWCGIVGAAHSADRKNRT
ncbi:hypothetical protein GCM10010272_68820 [Streptomyces lateritius]|nr:hypothetical protein GCM10010272_68820 [Streptomyces lateritius]